MKKTDRKNKTNLTVSWPSNIFTIEELNNHNPEFINITLRVRLKSAISNNEVSEIGYLHNGKGRPRLVLCHGNITPEHITQSKERGVIFKDGLNVNVLNISPTEEVNVEHVETYNVDTSKVNV